MKRSEALAQDQSVTFGVTITKESVLSADQVSFGWEVGTGSRDCYGGRVGCLCAESVQRLRC